MMPTLATRTNWKLAQNELGLRLKTLKESGAEILDLSESNPTYCRFEYLNRKLLSSFTHPENLSYHPTPKGMLKARQIIQKYYQEKGVSVDPERIFLSSSTSEAYSFLFRLLTNAGERVLVPRPSYPLFDFIADLNDLQLDLYPLSYNGEQWQIDSHHLRDTVQPDTKAIVLVHPNNPTGSFVKKKEWDEILSLAREKSLTLISDEVFSDYAFFEDPERILPLCKTQEVITFTLSGISKVLGLPQMKLAWIVANGPKKLLDPLLERLETILDTYLSVSTPIQNSMSSWFSFKSKIQSEIRNRIQSNRVSLAGQIQTLDSITLLKTEGGWYAILRLPCTQSEEEWALEFLEKDHVYIHPGYFFDFVEEAFIVVSLLPYPAVFQEGIRRILKRIKTHS